MSAIFKAHIRKFITLTESDWESILPYFEIITVKKKENILTEGQICRTNFFVLQGCLRKFFINEKGVEQTTDFAPETWWVTDNMAYEFQRPAEFFIQGVEKSEVLTIHHTAQQQLLDTFPIMEKYFRFIYQRAYAAAQMRIKYLYGMSKEEFYHNFNVKQPGFVQRVPQYLLASFLDITPEYLSEIKKKNRS